MANKYDIFISYRREGGYDTAKHLNDLLVRDGYRVSFDIDTLRSGDFDKQLYARIDQCTDFILIVDAHAFDRSLDPKSDPTTDWLRCELAYALKKGKNIIPIFLSGVKGFPDNLPEDIHDVVQKNGPEYNRYYFNDFYETLQERFLHSHNIRRSIVLPLVVIAIVTAVILLGTYFIPKIIHLTKAGEPGIDTVVVHVVEKQKAEPSQMQPETSPETPQTTKSTSKAQPTTTPQPTPQATPDSIKMKYRGTIGSAVATMHIDTRITQGNIGYYYYNKNAKVRTEKRNLQLYVLRYEVNKDGTLHYVLCEQEVDNGDTGHFDIRVDTTKHTIKGRFYGNSGEYKVNLQ